MIACGFGDVQEYKPAVSGKNPVHPVHPCESTICPCLTLNRFPATRRSGLFQEPGPRPQAPDAGTRCLLGPDREKMPERYIFTGPDMSDSVRSTRRKLPIV